MMETEYIVVSAKGEFEGFFGDRLSDAFDCASSLSEEKCEEQYFVFLGHPIACFEEGELKESGQVDVKDVYSR